MAQQNQITTQTIHSIGKALEYGDEVEEYVSP